MQKYMCRLPNKVNIALLIHTYKLTIKNDHFAPRGALLHVGLLIVCNNHLPKCSIGAHYFDKMCPAPTFPILLVPTSSYCTFSNFPLIMVIFLIYLTQNVYLTSRVGLLMIAGNQASALFCL